MLLFVVFYGLISARAFTLKLSNITSDSNKSNLLGVDTKKLLPTIRDEDGDDRNPASSSLNYNVFAVPDEDDEKKKKQITKRKTKLHRKVIKRVNSSNGSGNGGNNKKKTDQSDDPDINQENMMMVSQSTYQSPVASLLLKKTSDEDDNKRESDELLNNMDQISVLMGKALEIMSKSRSMIAKRSEQ